jgi:hypothetical protein
MYWRHSVWLVLSAAALAAFVLLVERPARLARTQAAIPAPIIPDLQPRTVSHAEFRSPTNQLQLRKTQGYWEILTDQWRPAEGRRLEAFLTHLSQLTGRSVLSTSELRDRPNAPAEFGISPPALTVHLQRPQGPVELLLGARHVNDRQIFFQIVGLPGIFVADVGAFDALPASANAWRDPTLVPLDRLDFDRLRVTTPGAAFTLVRSAADTSWSLSEPRVARADDQRIHLLLRQLAFSPVLDFLTPSNAPSAEAAGLQPPRLTLTLSRGTNAAYQLELGHPVTNAPALYARRSTDPEILAVPAETLDLLLVSYKDLLDRRLFRFDPSAVTEIDILSPTPFRLVQTNASWLLLPDQLAADPTQVQNLLHRLLHLEVLDVAKEVVTELDLATYGLAPPSRRIILRTGSSHTNATALATLEIGALQQNRVFARVPGEAPVYWLSPADVDDIPLAAWQMRHRALWNFDPSQVARLTVRYQDLEWSLRRNGTNDWSAPSGWRKSINPFALEEAVFRLGQTRAVDILAHSEARARLLGADTGPQLTLEFLPSSSRPPLLLAFGKPSPAGHRYAFLFPPDPSTPSPPLSIEIPGADFDLLWQEINLADSPLDPP